MPNGFNEHCNSNYPSLLKTEVSVRDEDISVVISLQTCLR